MLADFYFTTCVGHDAKTRNAVLSILRTLRVPEPEPEDAGIAIQELERCDLWTRVYAVPDLLHAFETGVLAGEHDRAARKLLHELIGVDMAAIPAWKGLLDHVLTFAEPEVLQAGFTECARLLIRTDPVAPPLAPYMDLPAQSLPVLWFATLRQAIKRQSHDVVARVVEPGGPSRQVIDMALSGRLGRYCVLLAVRAMDEAGARLPLAHIGRICFQDGPGGLQPDLAELAYAYKVDAAANDDRELRRLLKPAPTATLGRPVVDEVRRALDRLGMQPAPDEERLWEQARVMADCLRHTAIVARCIEVRADIAFAVIETAAQKQWQPFFLPIKPTEKARERYMADPTTTVWFLSGASFALCDWLDRNHRKEQLPQAGWFLALAAADVLSTFQEEVPSAAAGELLARTAERFLDPGPFVTWLRNRTLSSPVHNYQQGRVAGRLIRWLMRACSQAVPWRNENRWLAAAGEVCEFFRERADHRCMSRDEMTFGVAVAHLMARRTMDAPWIGILPRPGAGWPHAAVELLLPLRPDEDQWYLNAPVPDKKGYRLVVAAGRCVHRDPRSTHDPWLDWDRHFAEASVHGIDPLLRLWLMQRLHEGEFDKRRPRIAEVLAGSEWPIDINRLMQIAFDDDGAASDLRDHLHAVLVARVEGESIRAQLRDDPLPVAQERVRRDALRVCIDWLALLTADPAAGWNARLDARRASARLLQSPLCRQLGYSAEHHEGRAHLAPDDVALLRVPLQVRGAVFDTERQRATVLAAVLVPGFEAAPGVLGDRPLADGVRRCVGLVEDLAHDSRGWAATIHIGRRQRVQCILKLRPAWDVGSFVLVSLRWAKGGIPRVEGEPTGVPVLVRAEDVEEVLVRHEKSDDGRTATYVDLAAPAFSSIARADRSTLDRSAWKPQPDTTLLRPAKHWATFVDGEGWQPMVEDRLALLSALAAHDGGIATLAWTGRSLPTATGDVGWVLDAGGGLLYAVAPRDFTAGSRERIDQLLGTRDAGSQDADQDQEEAAGAGTGRERLVVDTLLTISVVFQGGSALLELGELSDARLRWKDLFTPQVDVVEVTTDGKRYFTTTPPDLSMGERPTSIPVRWKDRDAVPARFPAAAMVLGWDPRRAELLVERAVVTALKDRDRWPKLCEEWQELQPGDPLRIVAVWGSEGSDRLFGRTGENFVVNVNAEEWWGLAGRNDDSSDRHCRVSHVPPAWRPLAGMQDLAVAPKGTGTDLDRWEGAHGIVCSMPPSRTRGAWGLTMFPRSGPAQVVDLVIEPSTDPRARAHVGDRIVLSKEGGRLRVSVQRRSVIARPLWHASEAGAAPAKAVELFPVVIDGMLRMAWQGGPGKILLAPLDMQTAEHRTEGQFQWLGREMPSPVLGAQQAVRRVVARTSDGRMQYGIIPDRQCSEGRYHWRIADELVPAPMDKGSCHFVRVFRGATPFGTSPGIERVQQADKQQQKLRERLDKRIAEAEPTPVQVERDRLRIVGVPLPQSESAAYSTLRVNDGQLSWAPEVRSRRGLAILSRDARGILCGSTRSVPAVTDAGAWKAQLQAAGSVVAFPVEAVVELGASSLYYIGPEAEDPVTGQPHAAGVCHRFEWAPGCCLVLSAAQLQFDGGDFAQAASQLFFGDEVRTVALRGDASDPVLDIVQVGVKLSEAHHLYQQARDSKIVHLLEVNRSEAGKLSVLNVEGANEDSFEAGTRIFSRARVSVADNDVGRLEGVLPRGESGWVHGRVDRRVFEKTAGRTLSFRIVWLDVGSEGVGTDERVFLTAGKIELRVNDAFLAFRAPEGLVGPAAAIRSMSRRAYSARADLLQRIAREGIGALEGKKYLVRLAKHRDGVGVRPFILVPTDFGGNVPMRREADLRGWLFHAGEPPLVTVLDHRNKDRIVLEVRPGVFASVSGHHLITGATRDFGYGAVIRLRLQDDGDIEAESAMPSDEELIPSTGRGVTLLPMAPKFEPNEERMPAAAIAERKGSYTFEGLPNAVARVVGADAGQRVAQLLRRQHPRPAWVRAYPNNERRVDAMTQSGDAAVRLQSAPAQPSIREWPDGEQRVIPWLDITFMDRSGAEVDAAASTRRWRPHDGRTWFFGNNDGIVPIDVPEETAASSLLFAQRAGGALRLRYTDAKLQRFVFPPRELAAMLPSDPLDAWPVSVAAVDTAARRLIVEVAPGRLYVLPVLLLVVQGASGSNEVSLSELSLDCLGPGDELMVCRAQGAPESIDRIRLVNWRPGARSALGGGRMALRYRGFDAQSFAWLFGAAPFELTLPGPAEPQAPAAMAIIGADNNVAFGAGQMASTAALLIVDDGGFLRIDVLPGYACAFHKDYQPADDTVGGHCVRLHLGRPTASALLVAARALPVTIEFIDHAGRTVYFSRRLQQGAEPEGSCAFKVIAADAEGTFLVRFGSRLCIATAAQLVHGLPASPAVIAAASRALMEVRSLMWARVNPVASGLHPPRAQGEGAFLPLALVGDAKVEGIICECTQTRALHWLPIRRLAWADLEKEREALLAALVVPREPLRARVEPNRALTAIGIALAESEFRRARPGMHIAVRPIGVTLSDGRHLVRSTACDVLLTLQGELPADSLEHRAILRRRDKDGDIRRLYAQVDEPPLWLDAGFATAPVAELVKDIIDAESQSSTRKAARERFDQLVRRAWRHWPRELVETVELSSSGAWAVYAKLRPVLLGEAPTAESALQLQAFCRNVELTQDVRGDFDLMHLAAAARALAGDVGVLVPQAISEAKVAHEIARLGSLSPPLALSDELSPVVVEALKKLLDELMRLEVQPTFGPPLPEIR